MSIPIIASLNGTSKGGWLDYASSLEAAGADALELNIYFLPTTDRLQGLDIETAYYDVLRVVKRTVKIPVAVKLSPFFSAIPSVASQLDGLGANALVLFNRFYQPDVDVSTQQIRSVLTLSRSEDILLPLRWIAILHGQVNCSLALTSGVHSSEDALKAILVGADVANVCSVLLKGGVGKLGEIVRGLGTLMDELGMKSVELGARAAEPPESRRAGGVRTRQLHQAAAELRQDLSRPCSDPFVSPCMHRERRPSAGAPHSSWGHRSDAPCPSGVQASPRSSLRRRR